jgi:hypothetical protein
MAIALVQDTVYFASTSSPFTLTFSGATTGGNLVTVHGSLFGGTTGPSAITDDSSGGVNSWNFSATSSQNPPTAIDATNTSIEFAAWSFTAAGGALSNIHVTAAGTTFISLVIAEWSGASAADTGAAASSTVSGTDGSVSLNLGFSGELVLLGIDPHTGTFSGAPSQATQFTGGHIITCYATGQSGSQTYTWTGDGTANDPYVVMAMAFNPPGGTPHTATGSLTVTPAFAVKKAEAHVQAMTVTPAFSLVKAEAHKQALTVTPVFTALDVKNFGKGGTPDRHHRRNWNPR